MSKILNPQDKKNLLKIFEIPEEFYAEALKMLSEQEISLILAMENKVYKEKELISLIKDKEIAANPQTLIVSAYQRYVISKKRDDKGDLCYVVDNFYGRYPYFAQFEYEEYTRFSPEKKKRLNEWDFEVYYSRFEKDVKEKMKGIDTYVHNSTFLTLKEVDAFIDKHKDAIYRVPCNCKCMMDITKKPRNVCINFDGGDNSAIDRGHGQKLTAEHAKELIRYFNSSGLMQNGEDFAICNCDGESCYPLQMARKAGSQGFYPKSNYKIIYDMDKCVNCGKCTTICNFGAFSKDSTGTVNFNRELCWGCTICSENCPKGAIGLEKAE